MFHVPGITPEAANLAEAFDRRNLPQCIQIDDSAISRFMQAMPPKGIR